MNVKDEVTYYLKRTLKREVFEARRRSYELGTHKCIFIHIPKTGGVSIAKSLLGKNAGHWTALDYKNIFGKEDFNSYFKFSFVRNPFTRLISAYEFLLGGGYGSSDEKIVSIVKSYNDWEDFILGYLTPAKAKISRHFKPQHYFICDSDDQLMIDYLGRFEELEVHYDFVRKKIGMGEPLKKLNITQNKKRPVQEYYAKSEIAERVLSIYKKDFELFGYSKEIPSIDCN